MFVIRIISESSRTIHIFLSLINHQLKISLQRIFPNTVPEIAIIIPPNRLFCIISLRGETEEWRVERAEFEIYTRVLCEIKARSPYPPSLLTDPDNPVPGTSRLIADSMLTFDSSIE